MFVNDVLGLYLRFFNISKLSVTPNDMPYIVVYTKPDLINTSSNASSWYKSRMVYVPNFIPTGNTKYTTFRKISNDCPNLNYATNLKIMIDSTVAPNPIGKYLPNEEILCFSISTSSSVINSSEFILEEFGIITSKGTQEFQYKPIEDTGSTGTTGDTGSMGLKLANMLYKLINSKKGDTGPIINKQIVT